MDRFRPARSSPPYKPTAKAPLPDISVTSSIEEPLAEELRDLSQDDVELLDTVVQRAGPSATTFLTVFKAYSEVLTDRGLDPHEVVYYSKLLKLGTMKGRNWGEKWSRVKTQWQQAKKAKPHGPSGLRLGPPRLDDDTATEFSVFSDQPAPRTRANPLSRNYAPSTDAQPPRTTPLRSPFVTNKPTSAPAGRQTSSNPSHRKRAVSPGSKRKEDIARDVVARAKERKGAMLNDTDAWKNIQMQHDEKNADLFREDRLVERCWQIWQQGYRWIVTTTEQIAEAREQLIVQRSLDKWKRKFDSHRQLYDHINNLSNKRVLLTFFRHWQTKHLESRQKKWRQDMRNKMKLVRRNNETRLVREAWIKWRAATQEKLVYQGYLERLLARTYVGWKAKRTKVVRMQAAAAEFYQNGRGALVTICWRNWKRAIQYRSAEATMRGRVDLRVLDAAMSTWRRQLHELAQANEFYERSLKARLLKRWSRRVVKVNRLEKRADKHLAKSDVMLEYAIMRIWKARKNGRLLEQARSRRLKALAYNLWKDNIASRHGDEARAIEFSMRPAASLSLMALDQWKKAFVQRQSKLRLADAFHMSQLALSAIQKWRRKLRDRAELVKAAQSASEYFMVRGAWLRWVEQVEARRRERRLHIHTLNRKKSLFEAWLAQARLARERTMAVRAMQDRISQRILRGSLAKWTERVITIKSREIDIVQNSNMVILVTAFQKWKTRHLQHVEAQNLLESFMYLKQRDALRRGFYRWLTAARFARHRREVIKEKEDEFRLRALEGAWDKWRERSLRSREDEILLQCQRNILCRVFAKWNGKTKAPPAIRFDAQRVKNNFFKKWRAAMSQTHKVKEAIKLDRSIITSKYFERWLEAYRAKKTLKAVAFLHFHHPPPAMDTEPRQHRLASDSDVQDEQPGSSTGEGSSAPEDEIPATLSLPDIPTTVADFNDLELAITSVVGVDPTEEEKKLHKRASSVLKLSQENQKLQAELKAMTDRLEAAERRKQELRQQAREQREQRVMETPSS
ncbi:hypothetical protein D9611_004637 [Ephemerocybe angulata]|uniref:Sfi1 spindle body domain-containing protein n=2 Tax=Ephemerocybe angulata TaxID=980116 RepID=A0A8H5EXH0_9AGAR|nr:hypothetical protein D9611_004637 [Tulosesus angulatus]